TGMFGALSRHISMNASRSALSSKVDDAFNRLEAVRGGLIQSNAQRSDESQEVSQEVLVDAWKSILAVAFLCWVVIVVLTAFVARSIRGHLRVISEKNIA